MALPALKNALLSYEEYLAIEEAAVIEVLSDSTESFDRGRKFAYYRSFPSLKVYVLVSQRSMCVALFRRCADGIWAFTEHRAGAVVELPEIGVRPDVAALYDGSTLSAA